MLILREEIEGSRSPSSLAYNAAEDYSNHSLKSGDEARPALLKKDGAHAHASPYNNPFAVAIAH